MRQKFLSTKDIVRMALFVALIIVGGFIKIPTPIVPVTLQFAFCLLSGLLLGGIKGSVCVVIYVLMGLIGIPVFTSGGGFSYILQPTFGYLIGFIVGTYTAGALSTMFRRKGKLTFIKLLIASLSALLIVDSFGVTYMYIILNNVSHVEISFGKALVSGCVLFLPTDCTWSCIASIIGLKLIPILRRNDNYVPSVLNDEKKDLDNE